MLIHQIWLVGRIFFLRWGGGRLEGGGKGGGHLILLFGSIMLIHQSWFVGITLLNSNSFSWY